MKRSLMVLGVVAVLLPLAPAEGDWLVTRDGGRIETRGAWEVAGRLVRFTRADGSKASMRLDDLDLEASRALTEAVAAPPPPPQTVEDEPKASVLVLTDEDFSHPRTNPETGDVTAGAPDEGGDGAAAAAAPASAEGLTVISWTETTRESSNGVEFTGTVRNNSNRIAAQTSVTARLYDEAGGLLAAIPAVLNSQAVAPGGLSNFRVVFPDIYTYGDVQFRVDGVEIQVRPPVPGAPPVDDDGATEVEASDEAADAASPPPEG